MNLPADPRTAIAVKRAAAEDIPAVMRFIDEVWASGHVLSQSRQLMDWQHCDRMDPDGYNWFIGENVDRHIQGVLGFIPTWLFDASLEAEPVVWLALWKTRTAPENNGLGLALLRALAAWKPGSMIAVQGINPAHPPMYRALGFRVGELTQYFVCNPRLRQSLIAAPAAAELPVPAGGDAVFEAADGAAMAALELDSVLVPRKTPAYFASRYLDHPFYQYRLFVIRYRGAAAGLVAVRVATTASARVLRIVDFMGDDEIWAGCGSAIDGLMAQLNCEYADFWEFGLNAAAIERAGFRPVDRNGEIVVPNYFEPFLARNGRIEFAVRGAADSRLALFRGDGDQDRPNRFSTPEKD